METTISVAIPVQPSKAAIDVHAKVIAGRIDAVVIRQ